MILSCNSCGKKFVVPDKAISKEGRLVQCGSCGNKWKQFPITNEIRQTQSVYSPQKITPKPRKIHQKKTIPKKVKKNVIKKHREISLYSPEYLAKKHGIKLDENPKESSPEKKVSFGFYNSLLLFLVVIIFFSRLLYFFEDLVVEKLPFTEFYIDYFFESMRNMFEIWKNLIGIY